MYRMPPMSQYDRVCPQLGQTTSHSRDSRSISAARPGINRITRRWTRLAMSPSEPRAAPARTQGRHAEPWSSRNRGRAHELHAHRATTTPTAHQSTRRTRCRRDRTVGVGHPAVFGGAAAAGPAQPRRHVDLGLARLGGRAVVDGHLVLELRRHPLHGLRRTRPRSRNVSRPMITIEPSERTVGCSMCSNVAVLTRPENDALLHRAAEEHEGDLDVQACNRRRSRRCRGFALVDCDGRIRRCRWRWGWPGGSITMAASSNASAYWPESCGLCGSPSEQTEFDSRRRNRRWQRLHHQQSSRLPLGWSPRYTPYGMLDRRSCGWPSWQIPSLKRQWKRHPHFQQCAHWP